ncbi:universal stress protein [Ligilactobacillus sp. WILCCON 0076]|uniref:Universal stress protein n=1 Tax=Ligilactobacillus ubinensis TaxID=2876789 RepID=A0A9X2FKC9_9LACO|nr:universal stress protein [Ligilactobacillus ubinensis]MCP0887177.1 universal stress protein [Ligilactobacillus ubinensis]
MSQEYKRILVAVDGSKGADIALQTAVEVAKRNNTHLDILRVLDLNSLEYGGAGIALDGEKIYGIEQETEKYLLDLQDHLIDDENFEEANVSVHLRFGNPKDVIVNDFQVEYENDLIVVGSTGKNLFQRIIVGSVASYVVRAAHCDVLMARTTEKDLKD